MDQLRERTNVTQITTKRRPGMRGKTTLELTKQYKATHVKVMNTDSYGKQRQITFGLDVNTRKQLLEVLLDHHDEDVG